MSVFNLYSHYYNLLYRNKEYAAETSYILDLILEETQGAESITELGCGTGGHAVHFAEKGFTVNGFDLSQTMIDEAEKKKKSLPESVADRLKFQVGDIRNLVNFPESDIILSLFHVMSYQIANQDLINTFKTVKTGLKPDGIFIFDFWYGPGVLSDKPQFRMKRFEDEAVGIIRFTEPNLVPDENVVDVNFTLLITDKSNGKTSEITELHRMRYLFLPELNFLLKACGLEVRKSYHWMTKEKPTVETWYCCLIAGHAAHD